MLKWAAVFFMISIVAGLFGFGGVAEGASSIAQFLFYAFVVLFLLFLALGVFAAKKLS